MRLTGEGIWGWPPDRENAKQVLRRAVELGVNFIDTAAFHRMWAAPQRPKNARNLRRSYPKLLVIPSKAFGVARVRRGGPLCQSGSDPPTRAPLAREFTLVFFAEFLEARILPKRIEHRIESEQRRSERRKLSESSRSIVSARARRRFVRSADRPVADPKVASVSIGHS